MTVYIAFLRAINVGGHTVKMDHLRALFEELELEHVETFIASGNVIFESGAAAQALEKRIQPHLKQALGYEVATFLRTAAELTAVVACQPFAPAELNAEGGSLYVAFLPTPPGDEAQRKLLSLQTSTDTFHVHGREMYWLCRTRMSDSVFSGAVLEKTLGMPTTLRNITTLQKLADKYPG